MRKLLYALYCEALHRYECPLCRWRTDVLTSIKEWYYGNP